jgi:hypothetical protein
MDVQTFADGTFAYRCLDQCPNTTQPCVIYQNNVATTSGAIHSSQIAPGDDIRCGCKQPPPLVCPLETGTKICESVQAVDCQATGTGDIRRPDVVDRPNGQVEGSGAIASAGCHVRTSVGDWSRRERDANLVR